MLGLAAHKPHSQALVQNLGMSTCTCIPCNSGRSKVHNFSSGFFFQLGKDEEFVHLHGCSLTSWCLCEREVSSSSSLDMNIFRCSSSFSTAVSVCSCFIRAASSCSTLASYSCIGRSGGGRGERNGGEEEGRGEGEEEIKQSCGLCRACEMNYMLVR